MNKTFILLFFVAIIGLAVMELYFIAIAVLAIGMTIDHVVKQEKEIKGQSHPLQELNSNWQEHFPHKSANHQSSAFSPRVTGNEPRRKTYGEKETRWGRKERAYKVILAFLARLSVDADEEELEALINQLFDLMEEEDEH